MGHLLGEGRIWAHKNQVSSPKKSPGSCLVIIFPKTAWTPPPKWPSQISFLSLNTLVNLCTKQSLPPGYSRLLWVCAPSNHSQGADQAPSSTLPGGFLLTWALSSPAAVHYLLTWKVRALRSRILSEGRGAFPSSRRFKPQGLGVVWNGTCLLKVRSFLAHAPNVVAMCSGKQTHSEGQCR